MESALTPGPLEPDESQSSKLSSVNPSDMDSVSGGGPGAGPSDNDSDSDDSSDDGRESEAAPQVEWLAMGRERRSTAGNRMKSMLANEEPDSDLELLFAEDENDQGFSDAADNASDVQMDSSSDDDDDNDADELEGEKELDREAKERRAAQRKRKAQDAIPAKFRKKVRIDTRTSTPRSSVTASTPQPPATRKTQPEQQPRPKKKSERSSWLPSVADMPTRASSRQTTRLSKEQLHAQMEEREAKRLKQVAQMQKKAARLEALKKPPMTQEERLQEAAKVEERNSKSLNRWEESEKLREEERRAKLAALQQRTLRGPVITFWSGMGKFGDGWRKGEGIHVAVEEKPKKAKREKPAKAAAAGKKKDDATGEATVGPKPADSQPTALAKQEPLVPNDQAATGSAVKGDSKTRSEAPMTENESLPGVVSKDTPIPGGADTQEKEATHTAAAVAVPEMDTNAANSGKSDMDNHTESDVAMVDAPATGNTKHPTTTETGGQSEPEKPQPAQTGTPVETKLLETPSKDVKALIKADIETAPEARPSVASEVPATLETPEKTSTSTQVPTEQTQPQPASTTEKTADDTVVGPTQTTAKPSTVTTQDTEAAKQTALQPIENESLPASKMVSQIQSNAATPQPEQARSPLDGLATTRTAIIYQNFDENAIKDKVVQTQVLFGRKMTRMPKPSPAPICPITNNPARYRDPKTNLHFYSAAAFKELHRLQSGEYRWSKLLGAWAGSGAYAARGVPERFLNPARCPTLEEIQRIERKREEKAKLKLQQAEDEKKAKEEAATQPKDTNNIAASSNQNSTTGDATTSADGSAATAEATSGPVKTEAVKTEVNENIKTEAPVVAT